MAPFSVGDVGVRVWCLEDDTGVKDATWVPDDIKVGDHRIIKEVAWLEEWRYWVVRVHGHNYTGTQWHLAKQFAPILPPVKKTVKKVTHV